MVRCIGEILSLKADCIPRGVMGAVLALGHGLQEVGCVQVHTGQGGQDLHADAGLGADCPGGVAQAAVTDDIALVVAAAVGQRLEVGTDVQPKGLFFGKVHRRALDRQLAAGRDALRISVKVGIGVHRYAVAQRTAAGVAVQVEIAVVRHVADSRRIGRGRVADDQPALGKAVADLQLQIAGETVRPGRAERRHRHAVGLAGGQRNIKQRVVEAVQAAVQAVSVLVGGHMDDLLIQRELRARNAVGKPAHGRTHTVGVQLIVGSGGVAQHNIHGVALAVRHKDAVDDSGVAEQLHLDKFILQHRQLDGLAGGGLAEIPDRNGHDRSLLYFSASAGMPCAARSSRTLSATLPVP